MLPQEQFTIYLTQKIGKNLWNPFSPTSVHDASYSMLQLFIVCHTKNLCRTKAKCQNCGDTEHENIACATKRYHCLSTCHKPIDKIYTEHERQKHIELVTFLENISFHEANERFPKSK